MTVLPPVGGVSVQPLQEDPMRRPTKLLAHVLTIAGSVLTLAPTVAPADTWIYELPFPFVGQARIGGQFQFSCMTDPEAFPRTLPPNSAIIGPPPTSAGDVVVDGVSYCGTGS